MSEITPADQVTEAPVERLAYRPAEAAAVLGIGRNKLFEMIKSRELGSVKHGKTRLIPRKAIEEFLEVERVA